MTALFVLIPLALVALAVAVWAFVWAVNHEQFEELDQEAARILMDDDAVRTSRAPRPPEAS